MPDPTSYEDAAEEDEDDLASLEETASQNALLEEFFGIKA